MSNDDSSARKHTKHQFKDHYQILILQQLFHLYFVDTFRVSRYCLVLVLNQCLLWLISNHFLREGFVMNYNYCVFVCLIVLFAGVMGMCVMNVHAESIAIDKTQLQPRNPVIESTIIDPGMMGDPGSDFIVCDDFNRPDSTIVTGWTEVSGDWWILNNELVSPGGSFEGITYDGSTMTGDFCITQQVIHGPGTDLQYGAVMGWFGPSNNLIFKVQDQDSAGYFGAYGIYQNGSGPFQQSFNFGPDPILQLEVNGTTATGRIDVDHDGIWEHEFTHTVIPGSGLCGIQSYGDLSFDDWCYGDECGTSGSTPTPTTIPTETPVPTNTPPPGPTSTPTPLPPIPTTGAFGIGFLLLILGGLLGITSRRCSS
jgi:hypothetical protein